MYIVKTFVLHSNNSNRLFKNGDYSGQLENLIRVRIFAYQRILHSLEERWNLKKFQLGDFLS